MLRLQRRHLPLSSTLQCFMTPDSISYLHNRPLHMFTSNARLRYWSLDNAASNNIDVWFEANGESTSKKTISCSSSLGLPAVGASLRDCGQINNSCGFCLFLLTTR